MVKLKVLDLFSGIGGFALGLESTGYFKTVQFVENEKWCQQILAKNFPGVPIHDDIKTYNTYQGVEADVVVGGFPYEVQSFIIPASAVNAPHQRYRTWIVAYSNNNGHQRGCIKTRNEVDARENTSSIGRVNTENIGRSNNDGGNQTRSVTNGSIQGSRNNNQTTAANTTGVCEVSEREYIHQGIDTQNRHQENHDRTLVQNRQQGVQSSINRGLEQNQTTFENIKIRQRNDDGAISGVDTAYVENTRRSSWREQPTRNTESIRRRSSEETKWSTHTDQTARSSQRTETVADTDSKGLQRQREITSRTYEELKNFGNPCWWNTEPDVGRMVDGLPNRVDRLKGLGNAIVPQIAYQIGMAIKEAENDS